MVLRMDQTGPGIPSLQDLKKEYKQSRRYGKNLRKLPTIMKHEEEFKKLLSKAPTISESRVNQSRARKSNSIPTQMNE